MSFFFAEKISAGDCFSTKNLEVFQMAENGEVYKCEVCGMVVEVKEAGGGELVCCDQPMELQK